ncbi:MAG: hypothetical protein H6823_08900 [Planctomycetaceae bacterium]|nr:hypothetical protein [Planctomycetaceae bacterium]
MTRFQFKTCPTPPLTPIRGDDASAWPGCALWLLIAGGFGYRHLSPESTGEAMANSRVGSAHHNAHLKPIEQIQVGERVAFAINPTEQLDESLSFDANPTRGERSR